MAKRSRQDEAIDALEYLADGAETDDKRDDTYTLSEGDEPPAAAPDIPLPPIGPGSSADSFTRRNAPTEQKPQRRRSVDGESADYRCLSCAYLLTAGSGYRCSECGTAHDQATLHRWFSGMEESRIERIVWLAVAILFAKLWFWLPAVGSLAKIAASVAAGYSCWLTAEGKENSNASLFGMAGTLVSVLLFCMLASPYYYVVDMTVAGLLLAGLVSDPDVRTILKTHGMKNIGLAMVFVAPLAGMFFFGLNVLATNAAGGGLKLLAFEQFSLTWFCAAGLNIVAWGLVLWNVRRVQKTLFGDVEEAM